MIIINNNCYCSAAGDGDAVVEKREEKSELAKQ